MVLGKLIKYMMIIFMLTITLRVPCQAYEDQITHPALTLKAIKASNFNQYLVLNFGNQFQDGYESFVNGQRIRELFTTGSTAEDAGTCRSSTHFQNPLRPWIYAGIEESLTGWCLNYRQPNSSNQRSALTWGTGFETYAGPPEELWGRCC